MIPFGTRQMAISVGRRQFLSVFGGAAVVWPLAARAQQSGVPVVGFLHAGSPEPNAAFVAAFLKGLTETGFVEGRNVTVEYRWAAGRLDRLPEMAADLIHRHVAVISTPLSTQATLAAKAATSTIPIVFGSGGDPIALGLVTSFSRPGANVTGVAFMSAQLGSKRLGVLHDLLPAAVHFAVLGNSHGALTDATVADVKASAGALGMSVEFVYASTENEIEVAFATLTQNHADALLIAPDEFFTAHMVQLADASLHHGIPSTYVISQFAKVGGLMSYGPDFVDAYRQVGIYTGRILKGENPADIPVEQPTKFEFVINLRTARALGLTIPQQVLLLADEVIE
jgi:putative tryptophan/tyrosine transport system substrate-binding protein